MKNNKKILLIILTVVVIASVALIILKNSNTEEPNKGNNKKDEVVNKNEDVVSRKEVSNIAFDNISYVYDGKRTTVKLEITNNNEKSVQLGLFIVNVFDKKNELIDSFAPVSKSTIGVGDVKKIEFSLDKDLSNAYKLEFELPNLEFIEEE